MGIIKTSDVSMQWSNVLEMVYESRIDSVGLNERVNSLATRSIKKDSKLEALNMIVTMCDLTTLEEKILKVRYLKWLQKQLNLTL